jgi:rare lipoprotein A (peptidoglycan hydrolase)
MFGVRFFQIFILALCVCMPHWGRAHAADAAMSGLRLVAAANVKRTQAKNVKLEKAKNIQLEKTKKGQGGIRVAKAQAGAQAGKQAKRGKREPLPPASADLPQSGIASWVGKNFAGRPVASPGELHVMESFTAAHRAIPFNTILKVTDLNNGRSVLVRVNDRGPYVRGRIIDLARAAAEHLGFAAKGITRVSLELAGNDRDPDQRYYVRMNASGDAGKAGLMRGFGPFDSFDEAAALLLSLYKHYPDAELLAVREKS